VILNVFFSPAVGEDEEVSIKEVTDAVVAAVGFEGEYSVSIGHSPIDPGSLRKHSLV
jgi:hypothetical protein